MTQTGKLPILTVFTPTERRYERKLAQTKIEYIDTWETARETGFFVQWWIEGGTGKRIDLDVAPTFLNDNGDFITWINLFHYLTVEKQLKVEQVTETVKAVKADYIKWLYSFFIRIHI